MSLELRIFLTPALIGLASLAGRRWGPTVSGWLVGLPFTSGPVIFFLALDHGATFAAAAAIGTLAGAISEVCFCLTYGWLAFRLKWWLTTTVAIFSFGVATYLLHFLTPPPPLPLFLVVVIALLVGLSLMHPLVETRRNTGWFAEAEQPGAPHQPEKVAAAPVWDLPLRMIVATVLVLLLTGLAPVLGPELAGLLAPFPVYVSILAIFAHQQQGPRAAAGVLRGLLMGMFAFAGFFLVVALLLPRAGIATSFISAIVVALLVEASTLWIIQRTR
ncbi:MAG: hypothetical protein ACLQUY_13065 [Ktedonobacterales bacterium]